MAYVESKGTHEPPAYNGYYNSNEPALAGYLSAFFTNQRRPYFNSFGWTQTVAIRRPTRATGITRSRALDYDTTQYITSRSYRPERQPDVDQSGCFLGVDPAQGQIMVPGLVGDANANLHTKKIQNVDIYEMDFFPIGPFQETYPTGAVHVVTEASNTPEPASLFFVAGGALLMLGWRRR